MSTETPVVPTPFTGLTALLGGGFRPGEVTVIAGRPASGKSVVGAEIARRHGQERHGRRRPPRRPESGEEQRAQEPARRLAVAVDPGGCCGARRVRDIEDQGR